MVFNKILVPYDGSKYSKHALKTAIDLAKKYNSKILCVTCIDVIYRGSWYYDSEYYNSKIKEQKEIARKSVANLESMSKKQGIPFDFMVFQSRSVVEKIIALSETKNIDLVVMGSHGRTGFDKLLLGSVANGVVQHVKCPVMVIK